MKTISTLLLSAAAISLLSCSGGENAKYKDAVTTAPAPVTTAPAASAPAIQPASVAKNPEHGQPNHRCDIAVGAPLSAPPQPNLNAASPQFSPQARKAVAPANNPPHGEPGHVCM
ncbi:hypothetical protein FVR03_20315 [Pontibacter qinzhouensis]|uniref:Secreted protein n=1 Tax=Pontibacter qinzhouensis TaxID=2603253 RepID=A0A5C8J2K4_9BACT|nr:hypothetical protein [Pontibacter qinzhouensis]TXK29866.1 hypothetical protein FVR03_20315 [Pontibacter qinzhouensis]